MNLHPSQQEQSDFAQLEGVKLREEEHGIRQRVKNLQEQEDRLNKRIRYKDQENQKLSLSCNQLRNEAEKMSRSQNKIPSKPSETQQATPGASSTAPKQIEHHRMEGEQRDIGNRHTLIAATEATARNHKFVLYQEVVFFSTAILGSGWHFPMGRSFIVVKQSSGTDNSPTYSIKDRDVDQIIDNIDQRYLSTKKEFWSWKDDYEARSRNVFQEFQRDEHVEYRNVSGIYQVDSMESDTMPTDTGEYYWIRRREFVENKEVYGKKVLAKGSLLVRLDPKEPASQAAAIVLEKYGGDYEEPTLAIPYYEQVTLNRENQLRIHYKETARQDIKSRLGKIDEVDECVCHSCVYLPFTFRMSTRMGEALRTRMRAMKEPNATAEDIVGKCIYKPILSRMMDRLELVPQENLEAIRVYEELGNILKIGTPEKVEEIRKDILNERAILNDISKAQADGKSEQAG